MPDEKITAAVTAHPPSKCPVEPETEPLRKLEQWELVGLTKAEWDALEIPAFLSRITSPAIFPNTTMKRPPIVRSPGPPTPQAPAAATAPNVAAYVGSSSGSKPAVSGLRPADLGGAGNFEQYRIDPAEIETCIKQEAERRWRTWTPTKETVRQGVKSRPRLNTFVKQVRKEFYP